MTRPLKTLLLCAAACAACAAAAAGEPGLTAAPSLNAPLGARAAAMGQAFTAVRGGPESLNYNPAAPAFERRASLAASYLRGFEDMGHSFVAASLPLGPLTLTPGYMHFDAGSMRLNLSDGTRGTVDAETDSAAYLSAAFRPHPRLGLGLTAKRARVELAEAASASAQLWDLGALLDAGRGFTLGAALLNAGGEFKFEQEGDPAPAAARLGAAWRVEINPPNLLDPSTDLTRSEALFTVDRVSYREDKAYWQAGCELSMEMSLGLTLNLRGGYLFSRAAEGATMGFGFAAKRWTFDFSFDTGKEMNARQQAGVGYRF